VRAGEAPLLKGDKCEFNAASQSKKKAIASEMDQFDSSNKLEPWSEKTLEASEEMTRVLDSAPDQSAGWRIMSNRLSESWWRFAYLLFHRDPGLDELPAERDQIIEEFRHHILMMTHDPIRKNAARALALIERKPENVQV